MSEYITEMEKKVIFALAEQGPLSGYDFHLGGQRQRGNRKAMMSSNSWAKIRKHLGTEGLNLIQSVNGFPGRPKTSFTRRKKLLWLTDKGLIIAISNGVDLDSLLDYVKKIYPRDEEKALLVELSKIADRKFIAQAYQLSQTKKVDVNLIIGLSILGSSQGLGSKDCLIQFKRLNSLLRRYPKFHAQARRMMNRWEKTLRQFLRISRGVKS